MNNLVKKMLSVKGWWIVFLGIGLADLASAGPGSGAETPPQTAVELPEAPSAEQLARVVGGYNRWAAGLQSVRGGGRARVGAEGEKARAFDFSMLMARPARARIQGRWGSLATLFDLSGDPAGWTLYLPREASVVRSERGDESAGLLLPPGEIISVLMPAGIPPRDVGDRGAASRDGDAIRVVVPPGRGGAGSPFHRVLWLDPEDGTPRRVEVRRSSQLEPVILAAVYEDFEGDGVEAFPVRFRVEIAEGGQWAQFTFETIRINTGVDEAQFELRLPAGTRELSPEELTADFLPVDEGNR